jgi:hypothetical protein
MPRGHRLDRHPFIRLEDFAQEPPSRRIAAPPCFSEGFLIGALAGAATTVCCANYAARGRSEVDEFAPPYDPNGFA